jgi:hypothetical protein
MKKYGLDSDHIVAEALKAINRKRSALKHADVRPVANEV